MNVHIVKGNVPAGTEIEPFKIYIVEPDHLTRKMYEDRGHLVTSNIQLADIVHWTSGPDLHPSLYNEELIKGTAFQRDRDRRDANSYIRANPKQLRVGVGRGAQFLNAMAGGSMWQKVDGHLSGHYIYDTVFSDKKTDYKTDEIFVTSTHHQMMIPTKEAEVLGFGIGLSHNHKCDPSKDRKYSGYDPEVVWYEKNRSLCFQPRPELTGHKQCTDYFFDLVNYILRGW